VRARPEPATLAVRSARAKCIKAPEQAQPGTARPGPPGRRALLAAGAVKHVLLVRVARDQAVDGHVLRLADAVAARHGLQVVLRAPRAALAPRVALPAPGRRLGALARSFCADTRDRHRPHVTAGRWACDAAVSRARPWRCDAGAHPHSRGGGARPCMRPCMQPCGARGGRPAGSSRSRR